MTHQIKEMHKKFKITHEEILFSGLEKEFRITAMQEELDEYRDANNLEDELDALVDLVVFALGTAERQGILEVFIEAFNRVMFANMQKELGGNAKRGNFQIDLVKPEGWQSPVLSDLIDNNGGYSVKG